MTTLIQYEDSRCDERCYNAKHENCNCICSGQNHGQGYDEAYSRTIDYKKSLDKAGISWRLGMSFVPKPVQLKLF